MQKSKWLDLKDVNFLSFAIGPEIKKALEVLRTFPMDDSLIGMQSSYVFDLAEAVILPAIWQEVESVIAQCDGPGIPIDLKIKDGPSEFHLKSLNWAFNKWKYGSSKSNRTAMVHVLSRCVEERLVALENDCLDFPDDWWISLVLANLHSYVPDVTPELEDEYATI